MARLSVTKSPLAVHDWPSRIQATQCEDGLLVITLQTPATLSRAEARQQIRTAIHTVLASLLACNASEITLFSQAGQPLKLLHPQHNIGISISHEVGLSLAAFNLHGKVGVDVMALNTVPISPEMNTLATEYLGFTLAEQLNALPPTQQQSAFALAWVAFEASLKCAGQALTEWNTEIANQLSGFNTRTLTLSNGYVGAIAYDVESFN